MTFSIMIATRDRAKDLELTCAKLKELDPPAHEIIICADGCQDGTVTMLQEKFPEFRLLENSSPKGSVYSRDRMLRAAGGDVVVSLDDDSYPVGAGFLPRLRAAFEEHPEAAVIVFPELRLSGKFSASDKTTRSQGHYVSAYANCAAAMRRRFYRERSGFPKFFEHAYEEPDYAMQCYAAGAAVWFEPSLIVEHHESLVNRDLIRRHHLTARNELWS